MRRREFIAGLGGTAAAWPLAARAQQQLRRIALFTSASQSDPIIRDVALPALDGGLRDLGWIKDTNYRWDIRSVVSGTKEDLQAAARALVDSAPDLIIGLTPGPVGALRDATTSIPILFGIIDDPVKRGLVASLLRPGGNITGVVIVDPPVGGKWMQLLHQIARNVTRIAVAYDPKDAGLVAIYRVPIEEGAARQSLDVSFEPIAGADQIDAVIDKIGRRSNSGLISGLDALTAAHRASIIAAAARNRLPAIYPVRYWPMAGGLMSYGMDQSDMYRQLGLYVDRILRGARPADLPVMTPRKWELVINAKTAHALGIAISSTMLASADEVIE